MHGKVCRCCGEDMGRFTEALSGNPNICASCASLLDWADDQSRKEKIDAIHDSTEARGAPAENEQPACVLSFTA